MSGIEVAGLAFGILPILVEVVKSYSNISRKVHTLRHYSREVKSISERLKVYKGIFLNEVRLLLRSIEEEEEVESMLEDAADQRWVCEHLNDKLRAVLQDSFDACRSIIEETRDTIERMTEEMTAFDDLLSQKAKGESIKSALKRLGVAIKITFEKSRHDSCLANLRDMNGDLSALRSQVGAFQRPNIQQTGSFVQHKALPRGIGSIQDASQKLHEALCGAWCCDDAAHRGHYAKLCIDAQVQAEVRLDLAISCHEPSPSGQMRWDLISLRRGRMLNIDSLLANPPIWLYVQSMSTSQDVCGQQGDAILSNTSNPLAQMRSCAVNMLKKKASAELQQQASCRKRPKRVHFVDPPPIVSKPPIQMLAPDFDLCKEKSICKYLQQHYQIPRTTATQRCIGYLETPQMYKHLFYLRDEDRRRPIRAPPESVYSIFDVMRHDVDEALEVADQLRLAHKTALALLQFNNTPWLPDRWRLQDLNYFGTGRTLDNTTLGTLHLSSQISTPALTPAANNTMDGIQQTPDTVSDQIRYGINNTTLFFLGVALLEIAHWQPIEEKMTARDQNNEVFAARRLAAGRAPLGPQYQKIAEKCLQCNFGFGTKLSNKGLQTAVYNNVVCELETMIEKLSI
ncbi:hypothetical protein C7974DRAFT_415841 [Boeremia exigua]|uniref:uncharacterized protein n=1 Tax=Boeremia exigua TaxID=749465 RepID=UPI001E8D5BAC|nr:uncharacterized protein C7974DRAFT_415841 [Boeremia exigua]KAH6618467.1 hypothetical protein C7974DRAFT_415841 [Boeremia exigua]